MENTFTFSLYRFLDGSWPCIRCQTGLDVNQKRRLIYAAKRLGYIYSPIQKAYIYRTNCLVTAIAKFTKEN